MGYTLSETSYCVSHSNKRGYTKVYVSPNFKSKKALKDAVIAGQTVTIFQPGPFGGNEPRDGTTCVEGPHYPEPHRWYAQVTLANGKVVKVK